MKAAAIRYLNEIISLTVLVLMAVALIAGQHDAIAPAVDSVKSDWQVSSIRHDDE